MCWTVDKGPVTEPRQSMYMTLHDQNNPSHAEISSISGAEIPAVSEHRPLTFKYMHYT